MKRTVRKRRARRCQWMCMGFIRCDSAASFDVFNGGKFRGRVCDTHSITATQEGYQIR